MVGVAGKSKGCVTCKKRRVKCDEGKPTCKRCEKAGYKCGGYTTGLQFVNSSTAPFESNTNTVPSASSSSKTIVGYVGKTPVTVVPRIRAEVLPKELSLVAFQSEVCLSFMLHNFVWRTFGQGWLEPAAQDHLDPLSTQAVRALSNIFFGISNHQEDIQLQACLHYGKALKSLRVGLADMRKPGIGNLIIPVLLLCMHASYEEDSSAAVSHVRGLIMLLNVATPYAFQQDPLRKAFESTRAMLTIAMLLARQPSFLAAEDWKTIPWALDPWTKSQQMLLTDILVDVPGYLAEDDKPAINDDPMARRNLLERVRTSLFSLYCWRYTWEQLYPNCAFETKPLAKDPKSRPIPRRLYFRTNSGAAEIALYNATHLFLLGLADRLAPPDDTGTNVAQSTAALAAEAVFPKFEEHAMGALQLPDDVQSLREPAIEICRTFEFMMLAPDKNHETNGYFLFPLGIAWEVLKSEDEYRNWMRSMLDATPITSGYAVGRNHWFDKYYLPKVYARKKPGERISRYGSETSLSP